MRAFSRVKLKSATQIYAAMGNPATHHESRRLSPATTNRALLLEQQSGRSSSWLVSCESMNQNICGLTRG